MITRQFVTRCRTFQPLDRYELNSAWTPTYHVLSFQRRHQRRRRTLAGALFAFDDAAVEGGGAMDDADIERVSTDALADVRRLANET
jgi:hypothetical protein